jgi:pyruvate dehydrogenase complex dehydrogenase (E1) component
VGFSGWQARRRQPYRRVHADALHRARHRRLRTQRTRDNFRRHFEVDRYHIAHAAIAALAAEGKMTAKDAARAIKQYTIDSETPNPLEVWNP